jgi:hypothetical protein
MFIVLGVLVVLLGGVLALWPVHQAWIECLVAAIRRSLILPFPFVFVVVITTTAVIAILPLVVVAIVLVASPAVAIVTSVTLFHHTADLLIKPLAQFMTHLTSHVLLDLTLTFLHQGAICYLRIKNVLKVLCDRLKHLIAKTSAALDKLYPVLFVKGHIEPLKLWHLVGWMHVTCWESFCHPNHLFESLKMFNWQLHHQLLEDMVSARLHVDILPISRLFLVQ